MLVPGPRRLIDELREEGNFQRNKRGSLQNFVALHQAPNKPRNKPQQRKKGKGNLWAASYATIARCLPVLEPRGHLSRSGKKPPHQVRTVVWTLVRNTSGLFGEIRVTKGKDLRGSKGAEKPP